MKAKLSSKQGKSANANEDQVNRSGRGSSLSESPWPRLNKLFSVHSTCNQNLSFESLLCQPKKSVISTSHSNLRKHVRSLKPQPTMGLIS